MDLNEKSIQIESNAEQTSSGGQPAEANAFTNKEKNKTSETGDLETGLTFQSQDGKDNVNTRIFPIVRFAQKIFRILSCKASDGHPVNNSNRLNTMLAITTLICVSLLLCLYLIRNQSGAWTLEDRDGNNGNFQSENIPESLLVPKNKPAYSWNSLPKLFHSITNKGRLHIQVASTNDHLKYDPVPKVETPNNILKILGRPNYCHESDFDTPENVVAPSTTHLHLTDMADCHHYVKLILTRWKFPKIHHIKLHKMLIRKQEFHALTKFIDRHNKTLHEVEIDECSICSSPVCDAGLINYPNHDFQITITKRRESPDWI